MENQDKKDKKFNIEALVLLILVGAFLIFIFSWKGGGGKELDTFAQCLTEKGFVMYGAYWCSHCQNEKKAFGDSFQYINYVECTAEPQKCIDAGIQGYPTWTKPDGTKLEGEQGVYNLSQESGCPLSSPTQ